VVFEKNQGGHLVAMALTAHDPSIKTFPVVATKGKMTRAEPVVVAMQQGRVRFNGLMPELMDQCLYFDPESSRFSPDRMDAMVWGVYAAILSPPPGLRAGRYSAQSSAARKLPQGLGSGRTRATGSVTLRRR
jgi:phage terminase large subunit-like protein